MIYVTFREIGVAIVWRAIIIWEAIQNRSQGTMYKTNTKNEAKRLRAKTFLRVTTKWGAKNSNIVIAILYNFNILVG